MQAARLATSTVGFLPPLALCLLWELKETHIQLSTQGVFSHCIDFFLWSRVRTDMLPHLYEINIQYMLQFILIKVGIIIPVNE